MGHCGGGSATLDTFDMLTASVDWVEKGQAPESVTATGRAFPGRSRPLCAYPAHAQYKGQGLCWTTLTQDLQWSYDIYMMDARGHGLTDPPTAADTADAQVLDLVGLVHAMKFEKPILMGHSMGAATVMRIGAEYPDLARAIIMLDPRPKRAAGWTGTRAAPGTAASGGGAQALPGALVMTGSPEALVAQNNRGFEDLVAKCHKDSPKWDIVDCQNWALSKKQYHGTYTPRAGQGRGAERDAGTAFEDHRAGSDIESRRAALIRKSNEEAAKVIQHGKLVHIDGAAHNLHHDQRKRTVDELNKFLNTL